MITLNRVLSLYKSDEVDVFFKRSNWKKFE